MRAAGISIFLALAAGAGFAAGNAADYGYRIEKKPAAKQTPLSFEIKNPLVDSGALADPELHRFKDKNGKDVWWVYGTHNAKENIGAAYSTDGMKTWTLVPGVLDTSTFPWAVKHRKMWAPSCLYKDGKYYLSFSSGDSHQTCEDKGISIGVSDNPGGPFKSVRKEGPVVRDYLNKAVVIDQDLFLDEDGKIYMYFGGGGHCNVCRLNDTLTATVPFENGETYIHLSQNHAFGGQYMEGPFMIKRGKTYYLMFSKGIWSNKSYGVAYSTSESPTGPFKFGGIVLKTPDDHHRGPGHHSCVYVPENDEWLICYHAWRDGLKYRTPNIDRMEFDEGGKIKPVIITDGWKE